MNTFCTIITAGHLPFASALYKSLKEWDTGVSLYVLVADDEPVSDQLTDTGMQILRLDTLEHYPLVATLFSKYAASATDHFRWSLKPVFINYLLDNGFEKVIFVDSDVFFFNDYQFLFEALNDAAIILTPHWYGTNPFKDEQAFAQLLSNGYFNAGCVGSSRKGIPALQWWANACHYRMGKDAAAGLYDDQRYLDLLPLLFEEVQIIKHKGCNLGAGNYEECKRTLSKSTVLIDDKYPVVFIHFYKSLVQQILKGHDPLLIPYFNKFKKVFEESGTPYQYYMGSNTTLLRASLLKQLKWKMRIKTRIKAFLYKLARKL